MSFWVDRAQNDTVKKISTRSRDIVWIDSLEHKARLKVSDNLALSQTLSANGEKQQETNTDMRELACML